MSAKTAEGLTQLAATFAVRDIMIDVNGMVRADSPSDAARLLDEYPDYDCIPLPAKGPVRQFLARGSEKCCQIEHADLLSESTSLVDLPGMFETRQMYFVLCANSIRGFVHFSDLNHGLVRLPLYVLFQALESRLAKRVDTQLSMDDFRSVLGEKREQELQGKIKKARERDTLRRPVDLLYFDEVLGFAMHYGLVRIHGEQRQVLSDVRNRVSHATRMLIEEHGDVRLVTRARDLCEKVLGHTESE